MKKPVGIIEQLNTDNEALHARALHNETQAGELTQALNEAARTATGLEEARVASAAVSKEEIRKARRGGHRPREGERDEQQLTCSSAPGLQPNATSPTAAAPSTTTANKFSGALAPSSAEI